MRCRAILALVFAIGGASASPAKADIFSPLYELTGTLTGTVETYVCANIFDPNCIQFTTLSKDFDLFAQLTLNEGDNPFTYPSGGIPGLLPEFYSGTIVDTGGVLTGQNLTYTGNSCPFAFPTTGCVLSFGSAQTFNVSLVGTPISGVPETETWAMMLIGFAGVGAALRRRTRAQAIA